MGFLSSSEWISFGLRFFARRIEWVDCSCAEDEGDGGCVVIEIPEELARSISGCKVAEWMP